VRERARERAQEKLAQERVRERVRENLQNKSFTFINYFSKCNISGLFLIKYDF